jgi:3-hydroxyacyl-CoA dehydrogenase
MVEKGWLGNKTKQGFYKQVVEDGKKQFWPLNLETLEHEVPTKPRFDSIGKAKDLETLAERMQVMLEADDRAGELVRALTFFGFSYASQMIPEIADTPLPMDDAMRWGYMHEAGPFEGWDNLGVAAIVEKMKEAGFKPAEWVDEMLAAGIETFYEYDGDRKVGVYDPDKKAYVPITKTPVQIVLKEEKSAGKIVHQNPGATLIDLGDGVACVEFHTKMNALDVDIFTMLSDALDRAEAGDFEGIVVGNQADNFSVGANLMMVIIAAQSGAWDQIEEANKFMQDIALRMRYFPKPVVTAPAGLALGGGAEVAMTGNRCVAAAEFYPGLVELGAGVVPSGGGVKELLRRVLNPAMRTDNAIAYPYLERIFRQIGMGRVATSAEEARQAGFLGPDDRIVMNRAHLIAEAKREVLHMVASSYRPPQPELIYAAGRDGLAALEVGIQMFKEGNYITEYETVLAGKLVNIMCGGKLSKPTWVTEQYIMDLEREAFLSLSGEEKTQERMMHLLNTGKVLHN